MTPSLQNSSAAEQSQGGDGIAWPSKQQASEQKEGPPVSTLSMNHDLNEHFQPKSLFEEQEETEEKIRPWSSLIDKEERDQAWNAGHSMDAKKVTSALGYLDLKQICYCLAQALMKHIEFSQGFFFLGDLQSHIKAKRQAQKERSPEAENDPLDEMKDLPMNENLEFTYNLGDKFKIDVDEAKKRRAADS